MGFKFGRWLWRLTLAAVLWAALAEEAPGQESLRLSLAGDTAAKANHDAAASIGYYNLLVGRTAWRFSAGLSTEYNDNVHLVRTNQLGDIIFRPNVNTQLHCPLTEKNSLDVSLSAGYSQYLQAKNLNQFYINPGSGLSFDIYVGDLAINLHDRITVTENTYDNPGSAASNNGNTATMQNSIGVSTLWDLNQAVVTAGYDHANYLSLGSNHSQPDAASENLSLSGGIRVRPEILVGVEAGGGLTSYDQTTSSSSIISPNATQWNAGVLCKAQISEYVSLRLDGGYTVLIPQGSSSTNQTVSETAGYYFQFSLAHRVNRWLNYTLSAGRTTDFQFYGQPYSHYSAQWQLNWNLIRNYQTSTLLWWRQGTQVYAKTSQFDQYGAGLQIGRPITKQLSGSLLYQHIISSGNQAYTGNIVGLNLTYQF